jgi:hypothetical protein
LGPQISKLTVAIHSIERTKFTDPGITGRDNAASRLPTHALEPLVVVFDFHDASCQTIALHPTLAPRIEKL